MNFQKQQLARGLYFVGVPIGSARDITLRALDVLASAEVLAAEDTRSLRRLMDIHGVPLEGRKLHALHDHSKNQTIERLVASVTAGKSVAYASEAGMPLIADPGFELARAMIEAELPVTCAPGPSAVLTSLVLSGLPTDAFHFSGFLPSSAAARREKLSELLHLKATLVFYESPKRLAAMLDDAATVLGADRAGAVCREMTKKFEEIARAPLSELAETFASRTVKGEVVVLVDRGHSEKISETGIEQELVALLDKHSIRDAVDLVANAHDLQRRKVYQLALTLTKD